MPKVGVYLTQHKIIKDLVDTMPSGISVDYICDETNIDKTLIIEHLRIMEIDDYGRFIFKNEYLFISKEGVRMLADSFRKKGIMEATGGQPNLSKYW